MESLEVILSLIVTIIGFITSTVTFFIKYVKSVSVKTTLEGKVKITDILLELIVEAEHFSEYSGDDKKNYVMNKLQGYAQEHGLSYDVQAVSGKIEEIIALTKQVNIQPSK